MFTPRPVPATRAQRRSRSLCLERLEDRLAPASAAMSIPVPDVLLPTDLNVVMTGPTHVAAGTEVTYMIALTNKGPVDAINVALTDGFPSGETLFSATVLSGPDSFTAGGSPSEASFSAATVGNGNTDAFQVVANVSSNLSLGAVITNSTTATADNAQSASGDNTSSVSSTVATGADMGVVITGPTSVVAGNPATYTVTLTNNGPEAAQGVVLTNTISGISSFVTQTTPAPGNPDTFHIIGFATSVRLTANADIAPGNTDLFIHVITPDSGTPDPTLIKNTWTVSSTSSDPDPANNSSEVDTTVVQPTDLNAVVTGPADVTPGSDVTYTISLTNNGPVEAVDVALTDTLPTGETLVSETQLSGPDAFKISASGNTVSFFVTPMANDNSDVFQVVAGLASTLPDGTILTNTATATADNPQSVAGDNTSSASSTVVRAADVAVTESGPSVVGPGSSVTYTVTLANNGPSPASGVMLTETASFSAGDILVLGSVVVNAAPGNADAFTVTGLEEVANSTIAPGNVDVFFFSFDTESGAPAGATITAAANVTSTTNDPNRSNNSATLVTTLAASADLAVTKSGPATITAGTSATYTISLTDNGPSDAQTVNVTDSLPVRLILESEGQVSGADTFTNISSGNTASLSASTVASGNTDVFQVVVFAPADLRSGAVLTDTATVVSSTADSNANNNSATFNSTVITSADLTVSASGPTSVTAGTNVSYSVSLTNNGPSDAAGVSLNDVLPSGSTVVSEAQISGSDRFSDATSGSSFGFFAATMVTGDTDVFRLVAHVASSVPNDKDLTNTASITATSPNPVNDSSSVSTNVTTVADLAVTASGPSTVVAGTKVTYTIDVTENGPSDAQTVSMTDSLPTGLTLSSESQLSGPDTFTNTSTGNTASFSAATVGACNTDVFQVVALSANSLATGTVITSTASVSSTTTDPVPAKNGSSVSTTIGVTAGLTVTNSGAATATAGTNVTYTISLTNHGPSNAQNLSLTDALPGGLILDSETQVTGPDTFTNTSSGNTASFSAGTVGAGNTDVFQIVATLDSDVSDGRVLADVATVTTPSGHFTSSSVNTTLATSADLTLTNSGPNSVLVGAAATYTIRLTNNGPSAGQNVTLTDSLPSGMALISAQHTGGKEFFSTVTSGSTVTFTAVSVAAGNSDTFLIVASVAGNLADRSTVTNTATVSSGTSTSDPGDNTVTATTTVVAPQRVLVAAPAGSSNVLFLIGADGKLYQHLDASGWTVIGAAGTVQAITAVTQTDGSVVLFAEGTDHSLSRFIVGVGWQGTIGGKGTIEAISGGLDHTGQADVFVIDRNGNLDEWSTSAGWRTLSPSPAGAPVQLSAVDNDRVYAVTSNQAIYGNDPTFGWFPLTSAGFASSISATTDGHGNDTVYALTVTGGLFRYVGGSGWTQLGASGTIESISAGRDTSNYANVFATTTGGGLAENDTETGWSILHPPHTAAKLSATLADDLFAVLSDGSVYGHDDTFGFFPLAGPSFVDV